MMDILIWLSLATPIVLILYLAYRMIRKFLKPTKSISQHEVLVNIESGMRVWRIYRTIDRTTWAECDPALTERAACNYANYIKKSNPNEFVRCDNPDGMILFYE